MLVVGGSITSVALKAYRRTRRAELGYLALGFEVVALGFVLAGLFCELLGVSLVGGILLWSLLVLLGFAIIACSLYVQSQRSRPSVLAS